MDSKQLFKIQYLSDRVLLGQIKAQQDKDLDSSDYLEALIAEAKKRELIK